MAKENNSTNFKNIMPIIMLAGIGVGGYFIWKKFFKEEQEVRRGFWPIKFPSGMNKMVGELVSGIVIGKNFENESYLCFVKLVNQETGELIAPRQTAEVGAGLSRQFIFEFVMPDKPSIRLNVNCGRIIDGEEKIDKIEIWTISSQEGYPIEICRDPYCFMVNNQAEEIQMNEFLGIDPVGMNLDSYLASSTLDQLDVWKNYWVNIWTQLHRADIVEFVIMKYNEYAGIVSARIDQFTITAT